MNPWPELVLDEKGKMQYTLDLNFAEFDFNWEARNVTVRLLGTEANEVPLLSNTWRLDELSGNHPGIIGQTTTDRDFERTRKQLQSL